MAPPLQRFGGAPNNMAAHYQQQYPSQMNNHGAGLPPPGSTSFMTQNSSMNPFNSSLNLAQGFGGSPGATGVTGGTGLASHDAQLRFAHGAAMQQQQANNAMHEQGTRGKASKGRIRDVWKGNLVEEMESLRRLIDKYPYISMDTEFPGVVARPMGSFRGKSDYHYQTLRSNVDLLKLIQLGITLFTEEGDMTPARPQSSDADILNIPNARNFANKPSAILPCTWQFNFRFSLNEDMYSEASIQSLKSAGVDFERHESMGIDPHDFGALLISSGLVCDEDVHWISFHGGYDFGYLTKLMLCKPLPDDEVEFEMLMKKFFPTIYDVKFLMKHAIRMHQSNQLTPVDKETLDVLNRFEAKQSLESLVEIFKVERMGRQHQGGSDAHATGKVFFQLRDRIYNGEIGEDHLNKVWGLGFPDYAAGNPGATPAFAQSTPPHFNQLQENNTPGTGQNGGPSTPNNAHAGLARQTTPAHTSTGLGPLTPGGGGGVFGNFQYKS